MAEELPVADSFSIELQWPAKPGQGGDAHIDHSIARLQMLLGDKSVTSYQTEKGDKNSFLPVPTYYLVEWLAQNWWSFLYEPRKVEREEVERDFRTRHWLGTARNGFALPDVTFAPAGEKMEITARSSFLRFAQLNFTESAFGSVPIELVRDQFSCLIDTVLQQLAEKGTADSLAHEAWNRVKTTTPEQEPYCRLIGSLGLSPYIDHPTIDSSLDSVAGKVSETMLADLCEATNFNNFSHTAALTEQIYKALESSQPANFHDLLKTKKPSDSRPRAYEWGYRATDEARSALGIAHNDPNGYLAFFEKMELDPDKGAEKSTESLNTQLVSGAVSRTDDNTRVAIVGTNVAQRKFSAARAAFLAWSTEKISSRLVTTARTRDQQASRAFAAELLAPAKYLKKRLGDRNEISSFQLDKLSEEMGIASTVVHYQARNNGYFISEAA